MFRAAELKPELFRLWKHFLSFSVYDLWPLCEPANQTEYLDFTISLMAFTPSLSLLSLLSLSYFYLRSRLQQQQQNAAILIFEPGKPKSRIVLLVILSQPQRTATEASLAQVSITDSTPTLSQWRKDRVLTSPRGSIQTLEIIIHHCPLGGVLLRCQCSAD